MPELPEVETIRKGLEQYLVGQAIESIEVRLPRIFSGSPSNIIGSKIEYVRRFGKGLVIDFENEYSLAIHIKMTGQLIYQGAKLPKGSILSSKVGGMLPNAHTHIIFALSANLPAGKAGHSAQSEQASLYYNDIRQFGWMKVIKTGELLTIPFFRDIGPEPLNNLTMKQFSNMIKRAKLPIKNLLMDQKRIAGVGNIYANDALFLSKIHPKRQAKSLTDKERECLFDSVETVLKKGIEAGGASEWQYVNVFGQTGNYQDFFQVYGKNGKPCSVCGTPIEKITLGGRGTFFCPVCQH